MAALSKLSEFKSETRFTMYVERFEPFAAANNAPNDRKVQLFLTVVGEEAYTTLRSLISPLLPAKYKEAAKTLTQHYSP